jgi:hypothetical protein
MTTTVYRKAGATQAVSIYQADDGNKLILIPVNRTYNQAKKPVYYLKESRKGRKPRYLSGLFVTSDPAVFSGDTKDPITGVKRMFTVTFEEGGERLIVEGLNYG